MYLESHHHLLNLFIKLKLLLFHKVIISVPRFLAQPAW